MKVLITFVFFLSGFFCEFLIWVHRPIRYLCLDKIYLVFDTNKSHRLNTKHLCSGLFIAWQMNPQPRHSIQTSSSPVPKQTHVLICVEADTPTFRNWRQLPLIHTFVYKPHHMRPPLQKDSKTPIQKKVYRQCCALSAGRRARKVSCPFSRNDYTSTASDRRMGGGPGGELLASSSRRSGRSFSRRPTTNRFPLHRNPAHCAWRKLWVTKLSSKNPTAVYKRRLSVFHVINSLSNSV